ncbi:MAG: hypothetical protein ABIS59_00355, partial [Candidatus Saccharibacteria bacterium]
MNNRSEVLAARNAVIVALDAKTQGQRRLNASRYEFDKALTEICPVIEQLLIDHDANYAEAACLQHNARHESDHSLAQADRDAAETLLEQCRQMLTMRSGLIERFNLIKAEDKEARAAYVAMREAYDKANAYLAA